MMREKGMRDLMENDMIDREEELETQRGDERRTTNDKGRIEKAYDYWKTQTQNDDTVTARTVSIQEEHTHTQEVS